MKLKTGRHTSALKEARKNQARRITNKAAKGRIKTAIKKFDAALAAKNSDAADQELKGISSLLDKAAKKNLLHKKTASRKISRLALKLAKLKK
jgi:small subunit ribosomal protein S20